MESVLERKLRLERAALVLSFVLFSWLTNGNVTVGNETIEQAVAAYNEAIASTNRNERIQKFEIAEQLFRQIIEGDPSSDGVDNPSLLVNMGNAAVQAERIGPAIVAFRQALNLAPEHKQAKQNLYFARSQVPDWIQATDETGIMETLFFWKTWLSKNQINFFASLMFLVAAILVAIGIALGKAWIRNLSIIPCIAWLTLLISLWAGQEKTTLDVVVLRESTLFSTDSENSATRISKPLPSGAEAAHIQTRDGWVELEITGNRSGWIQANNVFVFE